MIVQRHRIRRQVIEVRTPAEDVAARIHQEVSRIQRHSLESIIEECCSDLSSPDRVYRIEKLEVDLGSVPLQDLEGGLSQKLNSAMREALQTHIEKLDREASADRHPAARSQLELVAFFAENGTLPWWADSSRPRHLRDSIEFLLEQAPEELAALFADFLRHGPPLQRIVLHCDDDILLALFDVITPSGSSGSLARNQLRAVLNSRWLSEPGSTRVRDSFWMAVLTHAGSAGVQPQVSTGGVAAPSPFWLRVFARLSVDAPDTYRVLAAAVSGFAQTPESRIADDVMRPLIAALAEGETRPAGNLPNELAAEGKQQRREVLDLAFGDADTVYVENSGLVILWPFLERFFGRLELLDGGKFKDVAAQHRAAGLLQYLVTEDPTPPEYQVLLNKLLCGMEPQDILDFGTAVTDAESEECTNLISAVIENAAVLRNMSHDGFRGSFLLRKGMLSAGDATWILRVERETFDVVLDRFPWSFSWVKLPWMEVPLGVEW